MSLRRASLAFLALSALAAVARADDLSLSDAAHGFSLTRPADDWITYATTPETPSAAYALTLFPRGTQGLPSAVVYVAEHDGKATAQDARQAAVDKLKKEGATQLVLDEAPLAGQTAARLRAHTATTTGQSYEVELRYLVAPPLVYAVQIAWAAGDEPDAPLAALRDSFAIFPPDRTAVDPDGKRLQSLADRCGSELSWARDWDEATARAKSEDKPVLVVFEHYTGLAVPHVIASGVLMDADFVTLARERFVLLRLQPGDAAPFRDPTAWGMGPLSWGGCALFVSADGKVLEQTGLTNAFSLGDAARRVLAASAPASDPVPHDRDARLDLAQRCLDRGELDRAATLLSAADSPRGHRLRATLLREQRRGEDALAELAAARKGADEPLLADIAVEEGLLDLRLARWDDAGTALQRAVDEHHDGPRATEAQFWLGALQMLREGFPKGRDAWRTLALAHPDDRWAWKAAANVLDGGAFVNGAERLDWPDAATFAAVATPPKAPLPPGDAARARRDAAKFLIDGQRADGSWIAPMDAFSLGSGGYTLAITALCGSSLLPDRHRSEDVDRAIRRAEDYLLAASAAGKLSGGKDLMGVYSIWARGFVLRFLAQCRKADGDDGAALSTAIDGLLDSVLESQKPGGGWPYVELGGSEASGLDSSASFLTAGVLIALLDARDAGVAVPKGPLDRGLAFLQRLRKADGSFRYFADVPEADDNPESAGRGPVCALALLRGGAGSVDDLRRALATFDAQRTVFRREWGKDVCHTGQQGQGVHYLFYDWAFAARAVAELPASERAPWRTTLLTDVLAVRDEQGGFADMPSLGRAYGTAMALDALRTLGG